MMEEKPDLTYLKKLSGGDPSFERQIVDVICHEFPNERGDYFSCIRKSNFKLASELVHKLKHKIIILGLKKSYKIADKYENNLAKNSLKLKREFEAILDVISNFIKQKKYL